MNRILRSIFTYLEDLVLALTCSSLTPIPARRHLLKILGIRVGVSTFINPGVHFHRTNISIGDYCAFGKGTYLDGSGFLEIEDRVHFGPNCTILTATHKIIPSIYRRDRADNVLKKTVIRRGCWIGAGSLVLPGVLIGEGCVIGAGSVVNKDCASNSLYAGVPAKLIKTLPVNSQRPFFNGIEI